MADVPPPLERHHFVRLDPEAWARMMGERRELASESILQDWAERGWPAIVRRPSCGDLAEGNVPLGIPLPPSHGRRRVSLSIPADALLSSEPPPLLRHARTVAPSEWARAIDALLAIDGQTRCFGSLAWQYLTTLPYLTAESDLDLLWEVTSAKEANRLVREIGALALDAGMPIDGELLTPDGLGVQWREWLSPASEVMAKSRDWVTLMPRKEVLP